jgi:hypothetical protein
LRYYSRNGLFLYTVLNLKNCVYFLCLWTNDSDFFHEDIETILVFWTAEIWGYYAYEISILFIDGVCFCETVLEYLIFFEVIIFCFSWIIQCFTCSLFIKSQYNHKQPYFNFYTSSNIYNYLNKFSLMISEIHTQTIYKFRSKQHNH